MRATVCSLVLHSNQKGSCCSLELWSCCHRALSRLSAPMCSHAPTVPTNGSDKPFPELWQVQRGSDKLSSRCATFFLSSGFKTKLSQNHRTETLWWTPRTACDKAASTQPILLIHCFSILPACLHLPAWVLVSGATVFLGLSACVYRWSWACECGSLVLEQDGCLQWCRAKGCSAVLLGEHGIPTLGQSIAWLDTELLVPGESRRGGPPFHQVWECWVTWKVKEQGTRLLFSLSFYTVQIWVPGAMPKFREMLPPSRGAQTSCLLK